MTDKSGKYEIPEEGSLGLLALGARGTQMWRDVRDGKKKEDQISSVPPQLKSQKTGSEKKLLFVGWDAADWQMIKPLIEQGKMPALKQLMENSAHGNIATLQPPLSPMLWTSIATAKRAYDHGILGFIETDELKGEIKPVRATSRRVKTFWNILNEAGLKTNVVNWWPSHPVEKLNGVMVSDHFHKGVPPWGENWDMSEDTVFPKTLFEHIKSLRIHPAELSLAQIWPFIPEAHTLDPEKDAVLKPLLKVLAKCCSVHNTVTYLMENTEWDMTAVYYEAIDHFSHCAMKYHPPRQDGIDEKEFRLYKGVMEAAYRFHDMMLQRLIDLAGQDCHIMLVSDHGFYSGNLRILNLPDLPAAPALEHRKYGIFVAGGPEFKRGYSVYGSTLLDITPAILHLFGLPKGEDMEGRVPPEIWRNYMEAGEIPSWERTEGERAFVNDHSDKGDVLRQLQEIGYVDLPESGKLRYARYELNYNLCLSYIDGNKLKEAVSMARKLFTDHADERSFILLAEVLLLCGKYEELNTHLESVEEKVQKLPQILFIRAQGLLYTGKRMEALKILKEIDERTSLFSVQLSNETGKALLIAGLPHEALKYYDRSLKADHENARALTGKAHALVEVNCFEEALLFLESSLEKIHYQPNAHYLTGLCFYKLGKTKEALQALQLCLHFAPKHQKAKDLIQDIKGEKVEKAKPVIVVSGLPRSGTSLMMQMLSGSGIEVVVDDQREKDIHNPEGYWEYDPVRKIGVNADWMEKAKGKVVKIVSPLLRYIPAGYSYKVIYMQRPLTEIVISQETMKGSAKDKIMKNFPFQLAADLQNEEKRVRQWLEIQSNIEFCEIEYSECLEVPEKIMEILSAFLNMNLDVKKGSFAVRKDLHRNKV